MSLLNAGCASPGTGAAGAGAALSGAAAAGAALSGAAAAGAGASEGGGDTENRKNRHRCTCHHEADMHWNLPTARSSDAGQCHAGRSPRAGETTRPSGDEAEAPPRRGKGALSATNAGAYRLVQPGRVNPTNKAARRVSSR
jgi:hypothetical protein